MIEQFLLFLMLVLLFVSIVIGVPIGFALLGIPFIVALIATIFGSFDLAFVNAFPARAFAVLTNPVFVAIPLFILMGAVLEKSGIAESMIKAAAAVFSHRPGGMAYAVILVGAVLAASTGIVGASVIMLTMIALPVMIKTGASTRFASGVICASGTLGQIIPPSILLILLADQISNAHQQAMRMAGKWGAEAVSVGDLFAGALLPGLLLVAFYLIYVRVRGWLDPQSCPPMPASLKHSDNKPDHSYWSETIYVLLAPLGLIILVLGSILVGQATPGESAAFGAAGAILLSARTSLEKSHSKKKLIPLISMAYFSLLLLVILKPISADNAIKPVLDGLSVLCVGVFSAGFSLALWHEIRHNKLLEITKSTAIIVAMMMLIVLGAVFMALVFRGLGGDSLVQNWLKAMPGGPAGAFFAVMAIIFLLGFIIEFVEIIIIVIPIAGPALLASGIDPVWLAILIALNLQTSFLTPPFGYALYYFRSVAPASITTDQIYRSVIPFIGIQLLVLMVVWIFPQLATFLPDLFDG